MKYPVVETEKPVKCSKRRCPALCFRVPEGQPIVIECTGRNIGCNRFVRGQTVAEAEARWWAGA